MTAPTVPEMKALGSSSPKSEDTHRVAETAVVGLTKREREQLLAAAARLEATPFLNLYDAEDTRVVPDTRRLGRLIRKAIGGGND